MYFQKNHRIERKFSIDQSTFSAKKSASSRFRVVWGIDDENPIDRTGTDETDQWDLGTINYFANFDFSDEKSQLAIFNLCKDMNKNALKLGIKRRDYNEEIADIESFIGL